LSTFQHGERDIKQKVISVINTFRGIYLSPLDLKINELKKDASGHMYEISGDYIYKNIFDGSIYERGVFEITLDFKSLDLISYKIIPQI
jgi:hypothetical protein